MTAPTLRSSFIASTNTTASGSLSVGVNDLLVILYAGDGLTPTFSFSGTPTLGIGRSDTVTSRQFNGNLFQIDAYQAQSTTRAAGILSLLVRNTGAAMGSTATLTVSITDYGAAARWSVHALTPPAGTMWAEGATAGTDRYARYEYGADGTAETSYTWSTNEAIVGYGGTQVLAYGTGTTADRYIDFTGDATAGTIGVRNDQAASLTRHTFITTYASNSAVSGATSVRMENSAGTGLSLTNKALVAYHYTLGPPVTTTVTTPRALSVQHATTTATRIINIGTASATNPQAGANEAGAPQVLAPSESATPAVATASITRIAPIAADAQSVAIARAPIAPWLLTSPLQLIARETGTPSYYDVTSPVRARINRTEDWDAFGADLGFSWDSGSGDIFVAFGDTFGSNWIGPFGGLQPTNASTLASASGGLDVATITELNVANASQFQNPTTTTEGYRNVTTLLSNGTYATFRYTSRDTVNNKLGGVTLVTGVGTLSTGATVSSGDPRPGGGWRSQTLAKSTDTNLAGGYTINTMLTSGGFAASGTAIEFVDAKHSSDVTSSRYSGAPSVSISSIARGFGVVDITTSSPHGLSRLGQLVYLTGITGTLSSLNGQDWVVFEVTSTTRFKILDFGSDVAATSSGSVQIGYNPNPSDTTLNPEVTLVPTGGVAVPRAQSTNGYRQYLFLMSVNHWGDNGGNLINHCVMAFSDDDGVTWTKESWRWDNDATFSSKITQIWPIRRNGYVYGFCAGIYRSDPPVVIRCAEANLRTQSAWEYWDGTSWVANSPSSAAFVWEQGVTGALGEPSVIWNEFNQCWVATFLNDKNWLANGITIELRSATSLTGPWSTPQQIHNGSYWTPAQGIYGGFIHPSSSVAPQEPQDLYFHVSLADPYSTYLLKASLGVPLKTPGDAVAPQHASATITVLASPSTGTTPALAQAAGVFQIHVAEAVLADASSTLTADATNVLVETPSLTGSSTLDVDVAITATETVTFAGLESSAMVVIAVVIPKDGAGLSALSTLVADASITAASDATLAGSAAVVLTVAVDAHEALTLVGTGQATTTAVRVAPETVALVGAGDVVATGAINAAVTVSLVGTTDTVVTTQLAAYVAAELTSTSSFTPVSPLIYTAVVALSGASDLVGVAQVTALSLANLSGTTSYALVAGIGYLISASLAGTSSHIALAKWVHYITNVLRTTSTRKVGAGTHVSAGQYDGEGSYAARKVGSGIMTTVAREQT